MFYHLLQKKLVLLKLKHINLILIRKKVGKNKLTSTILILMNFDEEK